jgi:hypothetical protein
VCWGTRPAFAAQRRALIRLARHRHVWSYLVMIDNVRYCRLKSSGSMENMALKDSHVFRCILMQEGTV